MSEYIGPSPTDLIIHKQPNSSETSPTTPVLLSQKTALTRKELTEKRMEILEEITSNRDFDIAELSTALNVQKFLETEDSKEYNKQWSKYFTKIEDWKLYFQLNPSWHNLGTHKIRTDKNGGGDFYPSFNAWVNNQIQNISDQKEKNKARKELVETIFIPKHKDWSNFNTLDHWVQYATDHNFIGLSVAQICQPEVKGGQIFLKTFKKWTKNYPQEKEKNLFEQLFPPKLQDWSKFDTIEKWQEYMNQQGWQGLSTFQVISKEGGDGFYQSFRFWTKKQVKDLPQEEQKQRRKELIEQLFPPKYQDWSKFDTIEKWQEYMNQQGWQGLSTSQIRTIEGGTSFYSVFRIWAKNKVKDLPQGEKESKRKELIEQLFPPKLQDWSKFDTIEKWLEYMVQQGWQGLSTSQIRTIEGGHNFYKVFRIWAKNKVKDLPQGEKESKRKELIEQLFPPKRNYKDRKEILQKTSEEINWHTGFTTEIVDITSEITPVDSTNKNKLPKAGIITPAQVLRFFSGREKFAPELYAQHIEELATYTIHRGAIDFLINYFNRTEQSFPQTIADFGSGPSTAYSAYKELWPIIKQELGILTPPIIQDFDNSQEMLNLGQNSKENKHLVDVTKEKIPLENSQIDMVQSTFMIHHFKPNEILQTLVEANRVTKNGGHLLLFSIYPFTDSFLSGVEQLGYQVITQQGEILVPNEETLKQVSRNSSPEAAKKLQSHFNNSFILFAQKIDNAHNTPSLESFIFNQRQRKTKRINSTQDFKESDINSITLETNIDKLIFFINYEIQNLISQSNEYNLPKTFNEQIDGYHFYSDHLKKFEERYLLIQQFRKKGEHLITPKETQKLVILREKINTARKTKTQYRKNHNIF